MPTPALRPPPPTANSPGALRTLRWTLLLLIVELTFEGLARKLNIKGTNVAIFLVKDIIVLLLGLQVLRLRRPPAIDFLWIAYVIEFVLFIPVIIATVAHDPLLAVFGAKEYLLYPMVAFATFFAFEKATVNEVLGFFRWLALLVVPTTAVALIQLHLPATHWLNMSVEGESLEGFAAAGHLRVSSTFPFVAQFCAFLNAEVFIVMIAVTRLRDVGFLRRVLYLSTVPMLLVSSYVTGSRGAVLVNCVIIAMAAGVSLLRFQVRSAMRVGAIIIGLFVMLIIAHYAVPDAFVAYSAREQGHLIGASDEIRERIFNSFFGWVRDIFTTPFLGNGIGIMSNGSQLISDYAGITRGLSWTETDFANTLFEGGIYLVVIWYIFRYYVIYQVVRRCLGMSDEELSLPSAFSAAFVIIIGLSATLGIQPPLAIWWWLSVGAALVLWWKSVEPKRDGTPGAGPGSHDAALRRPAGQSAYAARLHARSTRS
jgi:hypothetical protein